MLVSNCWHCCAANADAGAGQIRAEAAPPSAPAINAAINIARFPVCLMKCPSFVSACQAGKDAVLANQTLDAHVASQPALALEPSCGTINQRRVYTQHSRDGALAAEAGDLEIAPHNAISGLALREGACGPQLLTPSMLHCIPYVGERAVELLNLEREKIFLQLLHRAIEFTAHLRLRVPGG